MNHDSTRDPDFSHGPGKLESGHVSIDLLLAVTTYVATAGASILASGESALFLQDHATISDTIV